MIDAVESTVTKVPGGVCQVVAKENITSSTSLDITSSTKVNQSGNAFLEFSLAADDPIPPNSGL